MSIRRRSGAAVSRWALVHFALLGFALFLGSRWLWPETAGGGLRDARIVITQDQVDVWLRRYEATSGKPADDGVRQALIRQHADDEMLYRESRVWGLAEGNQAIDLRMRQKMAFVADADMAEGDLMEQAVALGLDADDAVIRNMLTHNMRLLLARNGERNPTDADVEAFYASHGERFASPLRYSGWQVYFSREARSQSALAEARAAKEKIEAAAMSPEDAAPLGDVSPFGPRFRGQQVHQIEARFGEDFARAVESVPVRQWSDPVTSPFGVHLVYVDVRDEPQVPPLDQIRRRVEAAWMANEREKRLVAAMDELREIYDVVVESGTQ